MDPDAYVTLLFDDDRFSRSRLYFWIIGCLNEFLISIEDNMMIVIKDGKNFDRSSMTFRPIKREQPRQSGG